MTKPFPCVGTRAEVAAILASLWTLADIGDDDGMCGQACVDIERAFWPHMATSPDMRPPADAKFKWFSPSDGSPCWESAATRTIDLGDGNSHTFNECGNTRLYLFDAEVAMRLIPDDADMDARGRGWRVFMERQPASYLWTVTLRRHGHDAMHEGISKHLPIAICIAALTARLAEWPDATKAAA